MIRKGYITLKINQTKVLMSPTVPEIYQTNLSPKRKVKTSRTHEVEAGKFMGDLEFIVNNLTTKLE